MADSHPIPTDRRFKDLSGQTFNSLTVVAYAGKRNAGKYIRGGREIDRFKIHYKCLCKCGKETHVSSDCLKSGKTKSCGCALTEVLCIRNQNGHIPHLITHGRSKTKTYRVWASMRDRCTRQKSPDYEDYGAKGISVCERWNSFENFISDMGEPPKGTSIDRINVHGNYDPSNCRWATAKQQARNKSNTVFIDREGEKKCLSEWCEILKLHYKRTYHRIRMGDSAEDAFANPSCVLRDGDSRTILS